MFTLRSSPDCARNLANDRRRSTSLKLRTSLDINESHHSKLQRQRMKHLVRLTYQCCAMELRDKSDLSRGGLRDSAAKTPSIGMTWSLVLRFQN